MKKIIFLIILLDVAVSCDKPEVEERPIKIQKESFVIDSLIRGSWYSFKNSYYTEIYFDSVDIYGVYEDIGFVPPIHYKIRNDSLIRYIPGVLKNTYEQLPKIEIVNDTILRLLYSSNEDTTYLYKMPKMRFVIKDIMNDNEEIEYLAGFRERYNNIVKK